MPRARRSCATFLLDRKWTIPLVLDIEADGSSYEPYRPDSKQFKSDDMGSVMEGWEDEKWLKTNSANVRKIMAARIALAATKGCDAIDPDNVDGYVCISQLHMKH